MDRKKKAILILVLVLIVTAGIAYFVMSMGGPVALLQKVGLMDYVFDLEVNDAEMGTVTVDSEAPKPGDVLTLRAEANYGYVFDGWYIDGESVSSEQEFMYVMPKANVTVTGVFKKDVFTVEVISLNPEFTEGFTKEVEYLGTVTLTANEIADTTFVAWFVDGVMYSYDNPATFTVEKDSTVYAEYFTHESVEITSWPTAAPALPDTPLKDVELIGGSANVLGYFIWGNPEELVYENGEYIVKFVPLVTGRSELETFITVPISLEILETPNVSLDKGIVSWDRISGAEGYIVDINGEKTLLSGGELSYALPEEMNEYFVTVQALGNGVNNVSSAESTIHRYVPPKPSASELDYGNAKSEYDDRGNLVKFGGTVGILKDMCEVVDGDIEVGDDYIIFRVKVDVAEYLEATTKKKILDLNKIKTDAETSIVLTLEVKITDPKFYAEVDMNMPLTMEDLSFGFEFNTMTTALVDISINGEFVESEQRRGTLHFLFIDLVGLEEPLYKWAKVSVPIVKGALSVELALCFDAVGAIGAILEVDTVEVANYNAGICMIKNGVPIFVPVFDKDVVSNVTSLSLNGELDVNVNFIRISASLNLHKGGDTLSLVRLNYDGINLESDLSGKVDVTANYNGKTDIDAGGLVEGSYRVYGQITFEYYLEIKFNFFFLPLDDFSIKIMDGSYVLAEWEYLKGGIPKTPYMDVAIHDTTPIFATDGKQEYFVEVDGRFSRVDIGTDYFMSSTASNFEKEKIVGIDDYYVYVLSDNNLRRVGRSAGTERTIVQDVNRVVYEDRNYIYYTTTQNKNKIEKLYRSDVGSSNPSFVKLPGGYEIIDMRYDYLLESYVIFATTSDAAYYFTFDGVNLTRHGLNEHKYWETAIFDGGITAYYRTDANGNVVECFIRSEDKGVTHANNVRSLGITPLGLFAVSEKKGEIYNYELGLYPLGKDSGAYVSICEVADPTTANRVAYKDGSVYFADKTSKAFSIYRTDGKETHAVCMTAYSEPLSKVNLKAEIHGDWYFIYNDLRGSADVVFTVDLKTLDSAPYISNGADRIFDKGNPTDMTLDIGGNASVLGLYLHSYSEKEYAEIRSVYKELSDEWKKLDGFMSANTDFWKKSDMTAAKIAKKLEESAELIDKITLIASVTDYVTDEVITKDAPFVNFSTSLTIAASDLDKYSYGVHTGYLVTTRGILPITINIVDSREASIIDESVPNFDKGNPQNVMINASLYDAEFTIKGAKSDAYKIITLNGVSVITLYPHYLATLPYGMQTVVMQSTEGNLELSVNVIDSRTPADADHTGYFDCTYPGDVVFSFDKYDEKYITGVSGNDIPEIGAYRVSEDGSSLVFSEYYLYTLLPGVYYYTVSTAEASFDIAIVVIETIVPEASVDEKFDLATDEALKVYFDKNDAASYNIYLGSTQVPEEYWYYSNVSGAIHIDNGYIQSNIPYGNLKITVRSIIYSGNNVMTHTNTVYTQIIDTRTPVIDSSDIIHIISKSTAPIKIKASMFGNRVDTILVDGAETIGYRLSMIDENGQANLRGGYITIPASYFVDILDEGMHTLTVKVGTVTANINLTLNDVREPAAVSNTVYYDIKNPANADYAIRLFGEHLVGVYYGDAELPAEAYSFILHSDDQRYHIISINSEYLQSLGLNYSDLAAFDVLTSVNSFQLYVKCLDAPKPNGNGGSNTNTPPEYIPEPDEDFNPVTSITVSPNSFSMDVMAVTDITFKANYGSNNGFGYLADSGRKLVEGTDYVIDEANNITLLSSYLATLTEYKAHTVRLVGSKGRAASITITVYDSRKPVANGALEYTYDKYLENTAVFDVTMYDSSVKYVKFGSTYYYKGFSYTGNSITLHDSFLDQLPFGTNKVYVGFADEADGIIEITLHTGDSELHLPSNVRVDMYQYLTAGSKYYIPYTLYEGFVTVVTSGSFGISSFDNNGIYITDIADAPYGPNSVMIICNGRRYTLNVEVYDSRAPKTDLGNYIFDKGSYEYTLDPDKAAKYDLDVTIELYDKKIKGLDIMTSQTISGNGISYEDYDREGNKYSLSYLYLYRLPCGDYTFYVNTTGGSVEVKVKVKDSRTPLLVSDPNAVYDYAAGGDHTAEAYMYTDRVSSVSYVDPVNGHIMLLTSDEYSFTKNGYGNTVITIKESVLRKFYDGYTYAFTVVTNTERTLTFSVTVANGPKRPFLVTYYSVPWKEGEPEIFIEGETVYEGDIITKPADPSHEYYNFVGFFADRAGTIPYDFEAAATNDCDIFLIWEPKSYDITLMSDGEVFNTLSVRYLSDIPALPAPTKQGYTFVRWTVDEANTIRFESSGKKMPHNGITLYAEWEINTYTIVFKHFNGIVLKEQSVLAFEDATPPVARYVNYYNFKGWSGNYTNVLSDAVVTAMYTPIRYPITYELNGGTHAANTPLQYTVEGGDILPTPTKEGNRFLGWYTNPELTGKRLYEIPFGTLPGLTLYAKWQEVNVITFNSNGGAEVAPCYMPKGQMMRLPSIYRPGHLFLGWYDGEGNLINDVFLPTGDMHLSARWERVTVEYSGDAYRQISDLGHYGLMQSEAYDEFNISSLSPFFDSRYKIQFRITLTMSEVVSGTETIHLYAATNQQIGTATSEGQCTLGYAQSKGMVTEYRFDYSGGSNTGDYTFTLEVSGDKCKDIMCLRYDAIGDAAELWNIYNISVEVSAVDSTTAYKINYVMNGGTNPAGSPTTYTVSGGVALPTPTRAGYTFDGWYTTSGFSGNAITGIPANAPTGITVYAKWIPNLYNVNLFASYEGRDFEIQNTLPGNYVQIAYGKEYTLPLPVLDDGIVFMGWYSAEGGTGIKYTDEFGISTTAWSDATDVSLYAKIAPALRINLIEITETSLGIVLIPNSNLTATVNSLKLVLDGVTAKEVVGAVEDNYYVFESLTPNVEYNIVVDYTYRANGENVIRSMVVEKSAVTEQTYGSFKLSDVLDGAIEYNGHYYKIVSAGRDWNYFLSYSASLNGYLATFSSYEENKAVFDYAASLGVNNYYFGLTNRLNAGVWFWENGEAYSYTNWRPGEPNNISSQRFAHFWSTGFNEQWVNSSPSDIPGPIIIEWGIYEKAN